MDNIETDANSVGTEVAYKKRLTLSILSSIVLLAYLFFLFQLSKKVDPNDYVVVGFFESFKIVLYVALGYRAWKLFKQDKVLGWAFVAIGGTIWIPGQTLLSFLTFSDMDPFVSGSRTEPILTLTTVFAVIGVIAVGYHNQRPSEKIRTTLNALSFGACITFISFVFASRATVGGNPIDIDKQIELLVYFAMDVILVSVSIAMVLYRRFDRAVNWLCAGMMLLALSDMTYWILQFAQIDEFIGMTRMIQLPGLICWMFAIAQKSSKPLKSITIKGENILTIGVNVFIFFTIIFSTYAITTLETIPKAISYGFVGVFITVSIAQMVGHFENKRLQMIQSKSIEVISKSEEKFQELATHDTLTNLANRKYFIDWIKSELSLENLVDKKFAIMFIDLDRFKEVNDTYGHQAGDHVIKELAQRIESEVADSGLVCRLGGDEFAIFTQADGDVDKAKALANRVLKSCTEPLVIQGTENYISCSIGIAYNSSVNSDSESLLRNADAAMYRAKELGRNRIEECVSTVELISTDHAWTLNELHKAIAEDKIEVYYQPIIEVSSQQTVGFEALARWSHPKIGMVPPDNFIAVAEDNGLIIELGNKVIEKAVSQLSIWQGDSDPNRRPYRMNINLSFRQLSDENLINFIKDKCNFYGVSPSSIVFEMTESALLGDVKNAISTLKEIQSKGFQIQIDDFGTGYSSLSYLKKFPVSGFKIDKSYIQGYGKNEDDTAIVDALVGLGKSMNLVVTAEGVDCAQTHSALVKMGCTFAQGYLYSEAIPANEVILIRYDAIKKSNINKDDLKTA